MRRRERYSKVVPVTHLAKGAELPRIMEMGLPLAALPNPEVDDPVRDAIDALESEEQRELLLAYFYERLSYREIAARKGWGSHERVRRGVRKGLDAVRGHMVTGGHSPDADT